MTRSPSHPRAVLPLVAVNGMAANEFVITGTGFVGTEKELFYQQVRLLGCQVATKLIHGKTTHLVCRVLLDASGGIKYATALALGIPVVSHAWLHDSLAAGSPCAATRIWRVTRRMR